MNEKEMTNQETATQEVQETTKPLKSVLVKEHKELMEENDRLLAEMQEREYGIDFKSKKVYDKLLKFLEKEAQWSHTTAAGLVMLYHNLREQKDITRTEEWDNIINLRSANVSILWQMMTKMSGNGFYEAKNFVEMMAAIGQEISMAVGRLHQDNQALRDNHAQLAKLDQAIDGGQYIDDTTEEVEQDTLADEVDPVTE